MCSFDFNFFSVMPLLHDPAVVAMPFGDRTTYMVFRCLRKHRSEFAQNNCLLSVVNTFISILSAPIYFRDGLTLRILGECHNCAAKPLLPPFKPF